MRLFLMERVTGIEPALKAWEALVLPLNYTRKNKSNIRPYFNLATNIFNFRPSFSAN